MIEEIKILTKIDGLQFMPVQENKKPLYEEWQITKRDYDFTKAAAIGLVCGSISGNVEAIDIDSKYDLTGNLFTEYKHAVHKIDPTLLDKLVVQKTVSGGYHFIYRCDEIDGNKKLAQRPATDEEKRKGDKVKVLLETRGEKGYIACYPTKGYEVIHGSFDNIQQITPEQRAILFTTAYSFNEVEKKEFKPSVRQEKKQIKGLTPIEDYNDRADVVGLLVQHGWKEVGRKGSKILVQRPGDTKAEHSGNYDEEKKWFSVFSTSTQFEAQTPYQPYAVFGVLECDSDWHEVPKKLYEMGYGDRTETVIENKIEIPSSVDLADDDYSFLATDDDFESDLDRWRNGTFEMGKSTGIPELDKFFRFKDGNLVIINGIDNVGKSTVIWYLSLLANLQHGWPVLMFSAENKIGSVVRKLIEFYCNKSITEMNDVMYREAKAYIKANFDFIKVGQNLYNYKDWINMISKAMKRRKQLNLPMYKLAVGDPYNVFKVDIPAKAKQNPYDYHYEAASVLQLFAKNNDLAIWLNCHVGTVGARNKDKEGFTLAPQKEDTEMGVMFANKADDFLTIHRITQHETEWMMTEIHVRKIKEMETGGRVTPKHKPIKLRMVNGLCGFQHFDFNPIKEFHNKNKPSTAPINFSESIKEQQEPVLAGDDGEEPPF